MSLVLSSSSSNGTLPLVASAIAGAALMWLFQRMKDKFESETQPDSDDSLPLGAVIGGTICGLALLVVVVLVFTRHASCKRGPSPTPVVETVEISKV